MKKAIIAIVVLTLVTASVSSQTRIFGIGASYVFQGYGYDGTLGEESLKAQSIGLNFMNFTGGFIGMYLTGDLGYVLSAEHSVAGVDASYRFSDFSLQLVLNGFTGLGLKLELGSVTAIVGGGLGFDITAILGDEYLDEYFGFTAIGMGPGIAASFMFSLSENFGFYAGIRGTYEFLETLHALESESEGLRFKGGLSIVPSVGMTIRT